MDVHVEVGKLNLPDDPFFYLAFRKRAKKEEREKKDRAALKKQRIDIQGRKTRYMGGNTTGPISRT